MGDLKSEQVSLPSREELIALCERAVVPHDKWLDRDTSSAQRQLGECLTLLRAGCEFRVDPNVSHNSWWVTVWFNGFGYFDWGGTQDDERFYIPTAERLNRSAGRDWY